MDTESQVWPMPVIMKNQMKVPECCDYLVESTRTITELFNESDSKFFISIVFDQQINAQQINFSFYITYKL